MKVAPLAPSAPAENSFASYWKPALVTVLAGLTVAACLLSRAPFGVDEAGVTLGLPYIMGKWWGTDQAISEAEKTILPSDTEFARKSYDSGSDQVLCSIVLSGAEKRSIHRPEICLPGQGWDIHGSQVVDIPLHSGRTLRVTNLTLTRPIQLANGKRVEISAYYMYWFVSKGLVTPSHWQRIWLTSWDRVVHHVNHRWAYVIVHSMITEGFKPGGKSPEETLAMMKQFVADIVPYFEKDEAPGS